MKVLMVLCTDRIHLSESHRQQLPILANVILHMSAAACALQACLEHFHGRSRQSYGRTATWHVCPAVWTRCFNCNSLSEGHSVSARRQTIKCAWTRSLIPDQMSQVHPIALWCQPAAGLRFQAAGERGQRKWQTVGAHCCSASTCNCQHRRLSKFQLQVKHC